MGLNKGEGHVDSIEEYDQALKAHHILFGVQMLLVTISETCPHMPEGFQDLSYQRM
jgi:hypothetical protein